jgi:hypothetical protein
MAHRPSTTCATSEIFVTVDQSIEYGSGQTCPVFAQFTVTVCVVVVFRLHRGHLWTNSYQVLVGPYGNEAEAELAHANLVSRGFKPRSYERGSRSLRFSSGLTVNGARLPVGDFVISWESYVPDAIVKFEKEGSVIGTTDGKWVRRGVKYADGAVVYRKNSDGSRTLLEIRFAGMSRALVFSKSS